MTPFQRGLWILVGACTVHVAEEYLLDWPSWVGALSGVRVTWGMFLLLNAGFLILACVAASIGLRQPTIGLALPSLTLINGVFFHIGPTILLGQISPGVFSATLLYVPISTWLFSQARRQGQLTLRNVLAAVVLGGAVMALPFVILRLG